MNATFLRQTKSLTCVLAAFTAFAIAYAWMASSITHAQTADGIEGSGFEVAAPPEPVATASATAAIATPPAPAPRLTDILRSGGPLMIPIGLCSFLLVVFVFERFISLRRARIIPGPFTRRFLTQLNEGELNQDTATALCERDNSPMAQVFLAGVQKWGRPSVEVEQAVLDEGERTSNRLRKYLRLINGVATLCPLFGLLGTVLGMIHAFDSIATVASAAVDPKVLIATGISQALLTTAAGLSVAIPALIAYLFFSSRVDKHIMDIDTLGMKVVNLVSAEGIASSKPTKKRTTRSKAA
jgi:biopolymer transport protein ExbB